MQLGFQIFDCFEQKPMRYSTTPCHTTPHHTTIHRNAPIEIEGCFVRATRTDATHTHPYKYEYRTINVVLHTILCTA